MKRKIPFIKSFLKRKITTFKKFYSIQIYLEQIKGIKVTRPCLRPDLAEVCCTATVLNHLIIVWLFARPKILLVQSCKTIVNQPIRKDRTMVRTFVLFRMIPDLQIHLPNFEGKFLSSQDVYDSDRSSNAHPEMQMLTQPVSRSIWQWHYWGQGKAVVNKRGPGGLGPSTHCSLETELSSKSYYA